LKTYRQKREPKLSKDQTMNRTKEQVRKAVFGKLKTLRRKLHAQGVACTYARSVLSHDNGGAGFKITYRASDNGDSTLLPELTVRTAEGVQTFDQSTFDQGLGRIKELFHDGTGGQDENRQG
jgi:hypothetical protein